MTQLENLSSMVIKCLIAVFMLLVSCDGDDTVNDPPTSASDPMFPSQKTLGGSGSESFPIMQQTSDGGFILVAGTTPNDEDVSSNHSTDYPDVWVVKLDGKGSISWEKSIGGSVHESPETLLQLDNGGYLIGAVSNSLDGDVTWNNGSIDWWIVRLDDEGTILWETNVGGSFHESPGAMLQVGNEFIIAGSTASSDGDVKNKQDNGNRDLWLVRLDDSGDILWENTFGDTRNEGGKAIFATDDNGYMVAAEASGDIWLVKFNSDLTISWDKYLGGSGADELSTMKPTGDGGYILSATSNSVDGDVSENKGDTDVWLVKINSEGVILWETSLGGSQTERETDVLETDHGNYWVAGSSSSIDGDLESNNGGQDYWVVKADAQGQVIWEQSYGDRDSSESVQ